MSVFSKRIFLLFACLSVVFSMSASDEGKYTGLIKEVSGYSSDRIIKIGDERLSHGDSSEAMVLYMIVCDRANDNMSEKERQECISADLKAGDLYYGRGDYARALKFYVDGLKLCEAGENRIGIENFYKNIGKVYCQYQDYTLGADYYKKAYKYSKIHDNTDVKRKILINLTGLYIHINKPKEARYYYEASLRACDDGNTTHYFMNEYNRGLMAVGDGRLSDAVACFKRLAAYAVSKALPHEYECYAYQELYKAYWKTGSMDSTLFYLDKCEQAAAGYRIVHMFTDMLKDASCIYEDLGMRAKSLDYKARFLAMSDSVFNVRKFDTVKNAQFRYEMEKTENEISGLRLQQEQSRQTIKVQRTFMFLSIVIVFVVTVFLVILYRQNKKLNSSYADLYALNRDIITRHEYMNRRHTEDLGRIAALESELEVMKSSSADDTPASQERKYSTSKLDELRQQTLSGKIAEVMDNTEEYCSPDFSLDRLATLAGSNSKYVSQVINSVYGKNFSNFVNEYRIRTACKRLSDDDSYGHLTVKAVGESVGYKSHATFVNMFKRITGLTPSLYHKMARNSNNAD